MAIVAVQVSQGRLVLVVARRGRRNSRGLGLGGWANFTTEMASSGDRRLQGVLIRLYFNNSMMVSAGGMGS
jgi:hypothetical protein